MSVRRLRQDTGPPPPAMSPRQRAALAALIHTPIRYATPRFTRVDAVAGIAWIVVTACALAWTLVIAVSLAPDISVAAAFETPRVAATVIGGVA